MNQLMQNITAAVRAFAKEEDGAQVIEYALIIAVVSLTLVVALKGLTSDTGGFTSFITKISDCLTTPSKCTA
jgi:pilus assembly protein Flp/PilA